MKTELDEQFEYKDDPEAWKFHKQMFLLCLVSSFFTGMLLGFGLFMFVDSW